MIKLNCLSLFSNVGIAETYFNEIGINVVVANEIDKKRADFYSHLYPKTNMIIGDIVETEIRDKIVETSLQNNIELIIATPPCQGMSIAGSMHEFDERNQLIFYAIDVIKRIKPKFIILENVPRQLKTKIKIDNQVMYIPDYVQKELSSEYNFNTDTLVKAMDYSVPQMRQRNIFLLARKDTGVFWEFPDTKEVVTLREVLKDVPSLDPYLREGMDLTLEKFPDFNKKKKAGINFSKWHFPPTHAWRMVEAMIHTPSGKTAFDNSIYYPKKVDGTKVKGHYNHYRRHDWDKPSRTITQNNGVMSSLTCVHPGHLIKDNGTEEGRIYSDPRVFSIYELLIVSSLPTDWNIPEWAEESFIRSVIGEGIPPLLVKELMLELFNQLNYIEKENRL